MPTKPLLKPDAYVQSVRALTPSWLAERGVSALLLDIDNTIVLWRSHDIAPWVRAWLDRVRDAGVPVCILSNSRRPTRCTRIGRELDLPFIYWAGKPRLGGFRRALALIGREASASVAMVGDQLFTDVVGGNRAGLYTVFVSPLSSCEFAGTKLLRPLERWILRRRGITHPEPDPMGESER